MPINCDDLSIAARLERHCYPTEVDNSSATAVLAAPDLYDDDRELTLHAAQFEVTSTFTGAASVVIGIAADTDKYASVVIPNNSTPGTLVNFTMAAAARAIPAQTKIVAAHVQSADNPGTGYVHVGLFQAR